MEPEEKAAVKAGATKALITTAAALLLPSPAAWTAALYGSYRMAKGAYQEAKEDKAQRDYWTNH